MGATARHPSGCRDSARREAKFPALRLRRPVRNRASGSSGSAARGDDVLGMILKEGTPSLRWRFGAARHVFADTALSDVDAQFEQFAIDAGCTPAGNLLAHPA